MTAKEKIEQIEALFQLNISVENFPVLIAVILFPEVLTRALIVRHYENAVG